MNRYEKEISLIHGVKDVDNKLIKDLKLRSLDGFDEEILNAMESKDLPFPVKTSYLLSRIVNFGDKENDENDKL